MMHRYYRFRCRNRQDNAPLCVVFVLLHIASMLFAHLVSAHLVSAQTPARSGCEGRKQLLFVIGVSGGGGVSDAVTTNERLNEVKQFALRTLKERSVENLLYKVISYSGSCNDIAVEVDWTRDANVVSAGIKGLYVRGGAPLGSAIEFTIDEIKKSAYPDETQVIVLADGTNECGTLSEIIPKRTPEIPCAAFTTVGIGLQEKDALRANPATEDLKMLAAQTGGTYIPLQDARTLRGVRIADTGISVQAVQAEPRVKQQSVAQTSVQHSAQSSAQPSTQIATNKVPNAVTNSMMERDSGNSTSPVTTQASPQTTPRPTTTHSTIPSTSQPIASKQRKQIDRKPQQLAQQQLAKKQLAQQQLVQKPEEQPVWEMSMSPKQREPSTRTQPAGSDLAGSSLANNRVQFNDAPTDTTLVLQFYPNSTTLLPHSKEDLEQLIEYLMFYTGRRSNVRITVDGHSSQEGTAAGNLRLSVNRASLVAVSLRARTRLSDAAVRWNAFGVLRPGSGEIEPSARANNRHVEIRIRF
jgi:outer membrane protein OmpA-like peptidoglycan-associated protein